MSSQAMNIDDTIAALRVELQEEHHCHTVILYGSRAGDTASEASDYDLAGFGDVAETRRLARVRQDRFDDLFVYPQAYLADPPLELLKLRGGVVLVERDGLGTALLARLEERFRASPPKLPADELEARRVWAGKMLERTKRGDAEGNYRRVWLLTALLEDYFQLRGLWFLGPTSALAWLREHDPEASRAFEEGLRTEAGSEAIAALVRLVIGR